MQAGYEENEKSLFWTSICMASSRVVNGATSGVVHLGAGNNVTRTFRAESDPKNDILDPF